METQMAMTTASVLKARNKLKTPVRIARQLKRNAAKFKRRVSAIAAGATSSGIRTELTQRRKGGIFKWCFASSRLGVFALNLHAPDWA
jgi:hypothetical protein